MSHPSALPATTPWPDMFCSTCGAFQPMTDNDPAGMALRDLCCLHCGLVITSYRAVSPSEGSAPDTCFQCGHSRESHGRATGCLVYDCDCPNISLATPIAPDTPKYELPEPDDSFVPCADCGARLHPDDAKLVTCCEACWDRHYGRTPMQPALVPRHIVMEFSRLSCQIAGAEDGDPLDWAKLIAAIDRLRVPPSAPDTPTWREAASAPQTGEHILVTKLGRAGFGYCGVRNVQQDWCAVVHYWPVEDEAGFYLSSGASASVDDYPVHFTHWMPLP